MMILILVLLLALFIIIFCNYDEEIAGIIGIAFVICLVVTGFLINNIVNCRTLNEKIEMYTEENAKIEAQMDTLVEQYMNYESDIYGDLKDESAITLISLYPELKADALVTKQIELYIENNEKIKHLKEKLIDVTKYKWWVYFGK